MNYKFLLFDWDGCLVNTLPVWLSAYKKVYQKYGLNPTTEEIVAKSWGNWEKGPENFGIKNSKQAVDEVLVELSKNYALAPFHNGVHDVLEELYENKRKMALISSSNREQVGAALQFLKAKKYFDLIIVKEDVKKYKPDPEGVLKAVNFYKAKKEECLMIGDSDKDIQAGKNAGVKTVLFYPEENRPFYREEEIKKVGADYLITDFRELLKII